MSARQRGREQTWSVSGNYTPNELSRDLRRVTIHEKLQVHNGCRKARGVAFHPFGNDRRLRDRRSPGEAPPVRLNRRSAAKLLVAPAVMAGLRTFASAGAEPYPGKPVRIIVPYPAGGPYDGIPRLIAQWIGAQHGWSIVI